MIDVNDESHLRRPDDTTASDESTARAFTPSVDTPSVDTPRTLPTFEQIPCITWVSQNPQEYARRVGVIAQSVADNPHSDEGSTEFVSMDINNLLAHCAEPFAACSAPFMRWLANMAPSALETLCAKLRALNVYEAIHVLWMTQCIPEECHLELDVQKGKKRTKIQLSTPMLHFARWTIDLSRNPLVAICAVTLRLADDMLPDLIMRECLTDASDSALRQTRQYVAVVVIVCRDDDIQRVSEAIWRLNASNISPTSSEWRIEVHRRSHIHT